MAQEVCVIVGTDDRARLTAIVGDRSCPLKHVQRVRIATRAMASAICSWCKKPIGYDTAFYECAA